MEPGLELGEGHVSIRHFVGWRAASDEDWNALFAYRLAALDDTGKRPDNLEARHVTY